MSQPYPPDRGMPAPEPAPTALAGDRRRSTGRTAVVVAGAGVLCVLSLVVGVVGVVIGRSSATGTVRTITVAEARTVADVVEASPTPSETEAPTNIPTTSAPLTGEEQFILFTRGLRYFQGGTDADILAAGAAICSLVENYGGPYVRLKLLAEGYQPVQISEMTTTAVQDLCPANMGILTGADSPTTDTYSGSTTTTDRSLSYCVIGTGGARLRSSPGVDHSAVVLIPRGSCDVRGDEYDLEFGTAPSGEEVLWRHVTWGSYSGWVVASFVE